MNIFKRLYNYFNRNNYRYQKKIDDQNAILSISFEVNKNGTINIVCDWPNFDESNMEKIQGFARYYAITIDAINSSILEKEIIDTLKNYDTSQPYNSLFIHNTLVELINIEKAKREKDINFKKPLISPLLVFKS